MKKMVSWCHQFPMLFKGDLDGDGYLSANHNGDMIEFKELQEKEGVLAFGH